ncbi:hypothetical protein HPB47_023522 [Ixodes persulcatus]|uniref:Uncharacterized protein n=1 Tax=Ixodes persulcatus TaxID=34615 RepID=A0AC60Q9A0_IXOPE|nr:hypothetical protein HPB47_023522 [Ixodes persulcatus]
MTRFAQTPPPHEDSMEETAPSAAHLGRADYFAVETLLAMSRHGKDSVVRPPPGMDLTPPNSEDEQEEASPGKGGCSRSSELARLLLADSRPTPTAPQTCTPVSVIVRAPPKSRPLVAGTPPPPPPPPRPEPLRPVVAIAPKPALSILPTMVHAEETLVQTLVPMGAVRLLVARPVPTTLFIGAPANNAPSTPEERRRSYVCGYAGCGKTYFKELAPQGPRANAHGGAPLRLPVGRLRAVLLALGRAFTPQADPHRREALLLHAVRPALHAQRPPRQARQAPRE